MRADLALVETADKLRRDLRGRTAPAAASVSLRARRVRAVDACFGRQAAFCLGTERAPAGAKSERVRLPNTSPNFRARALRFR